MAVGFQIQWCGFLALLLLTLGVAFEENALKSLVLISLDCESLTSISSFIHVLRNDHFEVNGGIVVYTNGNEYGKCTSDQKMALEALSEQLKSVVSIKQYETIPMVDYTVSRKKRRIERASSIIESLKNELEVHSHTGTGTKYMISIAFDKDTTPVAGPMFNKIYDKFTSVTSAGSDTSSNKRKTDVDVLLLGKNKGLTSASDWHDFLVVGLRLLPSGSNGGSDGGGGGGEGDVAARFLATLLDVYRWHGSYYGRTAFTAFEPRPATRETIVRITYGDKPWLSHSSNGHGHGRDDGTSSLAMKEAMAGFHYFANSDVCGGDGKSTSVHQPEPCLNPLTTLLTVQCSQDEKATGDYGVCMAMDEPAAWRHVDRREFVTWPERSKKSLEILRSNPAVGMWMGIERFRLPSDGSSSSGSSSSGSSSSSSGMKREPRKFCWESGEEGTFDKADAWIEHNITHGSPYIHPPDAVLREGIQKTNIVILTATEGSAKGIDTYMHFQVAKMYYAHKHGYKFVHLLSTPYTSYLHPKLFENAPEGIGSQGDRYFRAVMTKVVMVTSAMLDNPQAEWILWTDDDLYINPGWMHMPLEKYLEDVPDDKLYVAANYRTTFTNIFFIRNSVAGRALAYDWMAIALSGFVECHGYDQAAMGTLHLARLLEAARAQAQARNQESDNSPSHPAATSANDGSMRYYGYQNSKPFGHQCLSCQGDGKCGCNSKGDWSCDFKFEASAYRAGFSSGDQSQFFNNMLSSYTKGCANDEWPDFHVVTETHERPRLQCGLCTRLNEVESAGHWDGPLGGGNDKLRPDSINGWLFNHKSQFLFYAAYLNPRACAKVPVEEWIPLCKKAAALSPDQLKSASKFEKAKQHEHVVSLVDGLGFDVEARTYCRITEDVLLNEQRTKTYMQDYSNMIETLGKYSEAEWDNMLKHWGGGEGRVPCGNSLKEKSEEGTEHNDCAPWGAHPVDNQKLRRPARVFLEKHIPEKLGGNKPTVVAPTAALTMTNEVQPSSQSQSQSQDSSSSSSSSSSSVIATVKKFREELEKTGAGALNARIFESPNYCNSMCEKRQVDWSQWTRRDSNAMNNDPMAVEVDMAYRDMMMLGGVGDGKRTSSLLRGLSASDGSGTSRVEGNVVVCKAHE